MSRPDVVILNQYYEPDSAVTGRHAATIAAALAEQGYAVEAVVGQPSYEPGQPCAPRLERRDGVLVRRVRVPRSGRVRMFHRAAGYAAYLVGAWFGTRRMTPLVIVAFHNPPLLGTVAAAIAKRSGARLVYVPQDIHPDVVVETGIANLPGLLVTAWDRINRRAIAAAEYVIVLGEGMRATLIAKGADAARVKVIPLWAEPEMAELPPDPTWKREQSIPARALIVYAGNLGAMHPFSTVIEALLRADDPPVVVVAGGGIRRAEAQEQAGRHPDIDVRFLPFQEGDQYRAMLAAASATLVTLSPGMERLAVPSKAWSSFSAGRPVIAHMAVEADVARIVKASGAGWVAPDATTLGHVFELIARDPTAVAAAGRRARELYETRFTKDQITRRYVALVADVLGAVEPGNARS